MAIRPQRVDYMRRALALARRALGNVSPNPAVGAVVVRDGAVIGEGYTRPPGGPHAEAVALRQAGEEARGAALYVTLEPCCHFGRTGPCTRAIIAAGVAEVHVATLDPNPLVFTKGKAELEAAGIRVHLGEREAEAREVNEAFFKHITTGRPWVIAKFAMSLDGKIATRTGDSRWISGERSRRFVHRLRSTVDAIMVGVNTVLADDPQLTARAPGVKRQPLRVVVDSQGRTPSDARLLREPGQTLIAATRGADESRLRRLEGAGAQVLRLPAEDGLVDVGALLGALGQREVTSVLVEGGGTLLGSLSDRRLLDKVYAFVAPVIIGGAQARGPVGGQGAEHLAQALRLRDSRMRRLGEDVLVQGYTV